MDRRARSTPEQINGLGLIDQREKHVRVDDLVEACGVAQCMTAGCWRGVRAGVLPRAIVPDISLRMPGEIQRNISRAFRSDRDLVEFEWSVPARDRAGVADEIGRMFEYRDIVEQRELIGPLSAVGIDALVRLLEMPGGIEAGASLELGNEAGVTDTDRKPARRGADSARLALGRVVDLHEWVGRLNQAVWTEMSEGWLSRSLVMSEDILEGSLEFGVDVAEQISRAVLRGDESIRFTSRMDPARLLSTINSIRARMNALVGHADSFGILVPEEPETAATFGALLDIFDSIGTGANAIENRRAEPV